MDKDVEDLINKLLSEDPEVEVVEKISKQGYFFCGKVKVSHKSIVLDFNIQIPKSYPLTMPNSDNISITFRNVDLIGYNHINNDGSVCFHPNKDDDFEKKFKSELILLKKWIHDYYICKKEDDKFTYLIHDQGGQKFTTLFFTNNPKNFSKGDYGNFAYSHYSKSSSSTEGVNSIQSFFRIGIDKNNDDEWSSDFLKKLKTNINLGIWYFIDEEPIKKIIERRKGADVWEELQPYFSNNFVKYLSDTFKKLDKKYFFEQELFLTVGYRIPNDENYEVHWDLIKISKNSLPIDTSLIPFEERTNPEIKYESNFDRSNIVWGNTINCNYSRFFGRGRLTNHLTNSRILIIGCGALGSSLAEILVRGGCKNIVLDDFDTVKSGNICRSKYSLPDIYNFKTDALKNYLGEISPFVDILNLTQKFNSYENLEEILNANFQIIFDCSTDTEVTFLLDKLTFKGNIFSVSITNKAKELICVGGTNISVNTNNIYDFIGNEPPTFYEGTGCGYPTFEANFNDINCLLNVALKKINKHLGANEKIENFVVSYNKKDDFQINVDEYMNFYEPTSQSYLYITKSKLDEIRSALDVHYPKEFGGVFVGFSRDNLIIIDDILIPDKFENGRTVFIRHPGTLNERINKIHLKSKGKITYIGEWHSHPNSSGEPSPTDFTAMKEISTNALIKNENPILMIAELTTNNCTPNFLIYKNKNLLKYEQQN